MNGVVRGGVKFYRGSAAGARAYVEAGRGRADEYYLGETGGLAPRLTAGADGRVQALGVLDGDGYEAWVAGFDPVSGVARGRLRDDANALRFCEVVINGPKSWSIAAELHPEVAAAYSAAQQSAAEAVVGWFGQHASSRVGPRGGQYSAPVARVEACAVAHRTSRCGDPHRHIHLQINARVATPDGKWRGIDSVAFRDSIAAVQGIGHAAVMCDPGFRSALAGAGYTLDAQSGEVRELVGFVDAFSKRHAQIAEKARAYEQEWLAANPGQVPGWGLRRGWDTRAWAAGRPDKIAPVAGEPAPHVRWAGELADLGFRAPQRPVELVGRSVGELDRDLLTGRVLARVSAARSGFNAADVRGQAELLVAQAGVVVEAGVRTELVEDLTARAMDQAVPLLGERAVPEHVRAFTSPQAVEVERDLTGRFAARAAADAVHGLEASGQQVAAAAVAAGVELDPAQAQAVSTLAGTHSLVVVSGAAGAGKTTTLAAVRTALEAEGHGLLIVTPTLKAAKGAATETGAKAGSAAWLAHQHGWRWDTDGAWTRLAPGATDPVTGITYDGPSEGARLRAGDLLVVDEAGMLDQDTARALLVVADESAARVALVGDHHQLPAIGRGGVMEAAGRWTQREVTLDVIHRFTTTVQIEPGVLADVADRDYAQLSLAMRQGAGGDPGAVFDALAARGQVRVHHADTQLRDHVATQAAEAVLAGRPAAVCVATNEQVRELNTAIRDRLVVAGHVDDVAVALGVDGQRIGVGDLVVTRANSRDLDVANRDTWTVLDLAQDGGLTVTGRGGGGATAGPRVLPGDYVTRHVELGYASTVHGVQGATAPTGHLVLDSHTTAAAAYVGMTRGRTANTVHLVAADLDAAREQWSAAAARDRVDTGIEAAREAAELAAARYPGLSPAVAQEMRLGELRERLGQLWTERDKAQTQAAQLEQRLAAARAGEVRRAAAEQTLAPLREAATTAAAAAEQAKAAATAVVARLEERAAVLREQIRTNWDRDRAQAHEAAATVVAGPGRFGRLTGGHSEVEQARQWLEDWAQKWAPIVPGLRPETAFAHARPYPGADHRIDPAIKAYAQATAAAQLPEHVATVAAAAEVTGTATGAEAAYRNARRQQWEQHGGWSTEATRLPELTTALTGALGRVQAITAGIERLIGDPAVAAQPDPNDWLEATHQGWETDRTQARAAAAVAEIARRGEAEHDYDHYYDQHRERDHGIDLGY